MVQVGSTGRPLFQVTRRYVALAYDFLDQSFVDPPVMYMGAKGNDLFTSNSQVTTMFQIEKCYV